MSRFAIKTPYLIIVVCLIIAVLGMTSCAAHAGRHVSRDEHSGGCCCDVLQRNAAGTD